MPAARKDPTEPIRIAASEYPGVKRGTACTQSSFKAGKLAKADPKASRAAPPRRPRDSAR